MEHGSVGSASPGVGMREDPLEGKGTMSTGEKVAEAKEGGRKGSQEMGNERGALSEGEAAKVDMMVRMIGELYPRERWAAEDVRKIVEEAYQAADGN